MNHASHARDVNAAKPTNAAIKSDETPSVGKEDKEVENNKKQACAFMVGPVSILQFLKEKTC